MEAIVVRSLRVAGHLLQRCGPYLLLEILLPGGTVFALLLFLYRRRLEMGAARSPLAEVAVARALARIRERSPEAGRWPLDVIHVRAKPATVNAAAR